MSPIYTKLRGKRAEFGYSQKDVAKLLNMSVKTYNLKEAGKTKFSVEEAWELMKIFNCEFKDIFLR